MDFTNFLIYQNKKRGLKNPQNKNENIWKNQHKSNYIYSVDNHLYYDGYGFNLPIPQTTALTQCCKIIKLVRY
jgi:hypothetical protein